jgi:integrase
MQDYNSTMSDYVKSKKFQGLAVRTKCIYLNGIDSLDPFFGGMKLKDITRPKVIEFRDSLYHQPGKCRIAIATLNNILKFAYDRGWVPVNHAARLGDMPPQKEIERWQEDEIDKFLTTAPQHIKDAMMLALYTGQRRSDLVMMRWPDYDGQTIHVVQRKTGVELWIPVHPKLKAHLAVMAKRRKPFNDNRILTNIFGQPWGSDSLRGAFKRHCAKIGLQAKMLHGVRKTTASILGEVGCTVHQIMAITGHQSLKEVQRYTQGAEKRTLAMEAMNKWKEDDDGNDRDAT